MKKLLLHHSIEERSAKSLTGIGHHGVCQSADTVEHRIQDFFFSDQPEDLSFDLYLIMNIPQLIHVSNAKSDIICGEEAFQRTRSEFHLAVNVRWHVVFGEIRVVNIVNSIVSALAVAILRKDPEISRPRIENSVEFLPSHLYFSHVVVIVIVLQSNLHLIVGISLLCEPFQPFCGSHPFPLSQCACRLLLR